MKLIVFVALFGLEFEFYVLSSKGENFAGNKSQKNTFRNNANGQKSVNGLLITQKDVQH